MADPADVFAELGSLSDTWRVDKFDFGSDPYDDEIPPAFSMSVQTRVLPRSEHKPPGNPGLIDYYWLTHHINIQVAYDPDSRRPQFGFSQLVFEIDQVQLSEVFGGNELPTPTYEGPQTLVGRLDLPQDVSSSLCYQSSPQTTNNSVTIGSSISDQIGANAGMFGPTPTGGISAAVTTTHSTSQTLPNIAFINSQKPKSAVYTLNFQPTQEAYEDLQFDLQHIFGCDDDGKGTRAPDFQFSRHTFFRVKVALIVGFRFEAHESLPFLEAALVQKIATGHSDMVSEGTVQRAASATRLIFVPMPPFTTK